MLWQDWSLQTPLRPPERAEWAQITLETDGVLTIRKGYPSDGPSGPTVDTKSFMRGAFAHDALYNLMRRDKLSISFREEADRLLRDLCLADGMWRWRAWWVHRAVRRHGLASSTAERRKPILVAP